MRSKYLSFIFFILVLYFIYSIFVMKQDSDYARKVFGICYEEKIAVDSLVRQVDSLERVIYELQKDDIRDSIEQRENKERQKSDPLPRH